MLQCWKISGSASSTAARTFLTKYLRRKFSYILQEIPVISYTYKCHIIYLLFKKSKSILQVEIFLCWDRSLSHVRHHPFSEIYDAGSFIIDLIKAMLHGAIFLATCNAILLLRDVKLPNTSFHYTPLMFSQRIENSSQISLLNISQE
jgi:hypothetical protein